MSVIKEIALTEPLVDVVEGKVRHKSGHRIRLFRYGFVFFLYGRGSITPPRGFPSGGEIRFAVKISPRRSLAFFSPTVGVDYEESCCLLLLALSPACVHRMRRQP